MKFDKASGKLRLVALLLVAGPFVMAQDSGWYIGGNLGQSTAKVDQPEITHGLITSGFTVTSFTTDNNDLGYKLFGGYQFGRHFSLEGGYFDLGKYSYTAGTLPLGSLDGQLKVRGVNLDMVFSLPFTEKFSTFARLGANWADVQDQFTGTGAVLVRAPNPSQRAVNYKFGGGLQYDFTRSFAMRAELERYRIKDAVNNKSDIDLASLGVLFKFGRHAKAPVQRAEEPVAVQPAPVHEAVSTPVAVPARTQQYCTVLNLQFEIDQDDIQREDKEKFAVIGTFLKKYPETTVVIEGHSDNVGSEDHNMQLSKARAEAVVSYLADTLHIDRSRLSAVGYGSSRPLGDNATEEGKRQNRRIEAVVTCATDFEGLAVAPARITMAMEMDFDAKSAEVLPQYRGELHKVANFLKANPDVTATIEGHTGNIGTPGTQMAISKLRAENVVKFLVNEFGIDPSRLTAEGFGRTRQTAYNATKAGEHENRRVNIIINYPKKR